MVHVSGSPLVCCQGCGQALWGDGEGRAAPAICVQGTRLRLAAVLCGRVDCLRFAPRFYTGNAGSIGLQGKVTSYLQRLYVLCDEPVTGAFGDWGQFRNGRMFFL